MAVTGLGSTIFGNTGLGSSVTPGLIAECLEEDVFFLLCGHGVPGLYDREQERSSLAQTLKVQRWLEVLEGKE